MEKVVNLINLPFLSFCSEREAHKDCSLNLHVEIDLQGPAVVLWQLWKGGSHVFFRAGIMIENPNCCLSGSTTVFTLWSYFPPDCSHQCLGPAGVLVFIHFLELYCSPRLFLSNPPFFLLSFHRWQTYIAIQRLSVPTYSSPLSFTVISLSKSLACLIPSWYLPLNSN